jgi:hypothetical protein
MPRGGGRQKGERTTDQSGRGSAERIRTAIRPSAIENYLRGVGYPASRQDLIDSAKENGAPFDVLHILDRFSDRMYNSPVDVSKEVGILE